MKFEEILSLYQHKDQSVTKFLLTSLKKQEIVVVFNGNVVTKHLVEDQVAYQWNFNLLNGTRIQLASEDIISLKPL